MRPFFARAFLVCSMLGSLAHAQGNPLRIGVAAPRGKARDISLLQARDQLIKNLNHRSRQKKSISIEAVAIDASNDAEAFTEARSKHCAVVLLSHLTDLLIAEKLDPSFAPSASGTITVITASMEYELNQVSDRGKYAAGVMTGDGLGSKREAVFAALRRVAQQVREDLKRGPAVPNFDDRAAELDVENRLPSLAIVVLGNDLCGWLPSNIGNRDTLRGVCEFAMSLRQTLPNFLCDEETSRYWGDESTARDLITAIVRYEDGTESHSDLKVNGKAPPKSFAEAPGLRSTGEFGGDLRAIFDPRNHP
jgi:hypothetical protein